jgi:hypothetical protein
MYVQVYPRVHDCAKPWAVNNDTKKSKDGAGLTRAMLQDTARTGRWWVVQGSNL